VTLAALATGGGISVKQVRKWLANRRVRSGNTLTYNGAVHPRRLRRIRRQHRQKQAVDEDRVEATQPRQCLHSTPMPTPVVGPSSAAGFRVPPAAGSCHDSAIQTSTPLPGSVRRPDDRFEVDPTDGRYSTTGVRHHPYFVPMRAAATSQCQTWMPPTATPVMHRAAYFTAAANFATVHQMAKRQLNVFNVFNSI